MSTSLNYISNLELKPLDSMDQPLPSTLIYLRTSTRMEELGKNMVQHCLGLPLAITVLGGLLATKSTVEEWRVIHKNIKSYIRRGKVDGQDPGVLDVLALSYDDLPAQLKPCFLYLGHFPEDYEIPVVKLIQMWMAEGFIPLGQLGGDGEESAEEGRAALK
ncbi:hypothetical protein GH714_004840 [Hevea brasiliensis]|uniref:Disease resistance protein winged helix domain-containing protein n=1 Tax=Hevea brasiliensis TaxID=3981 RepID=A0A6A6KXQ6_HEVBR|nr:hypothetical protein GH714_004840 [Hevea brasiliensis]